LAQHVAAELGQVAQAVCLVGGVELYRSLGFTVIPDAAPDRGPLSGLEAGLLSPEASEWNLIVACDMPRVSANLFRTLADEAKRAPLEIDCVVPKSTESGKLQPLCAVYRRRCGMVVHQALEAGVRRITDVVATLEAQFWPIRDIYSFQNVNTPPEWAQFLNDR